jgi:hypothetical protein
MPPLAVAAASPSPNQPERIPLLRTSVAALLFSLAVGLLFSGCNHNRHTYDPSLRKIDELLSAQLPVGTPRGRVQYFLKSRGYQLEDAADKTTVRALVRHVDPDTLQPSAAHATFHFDVNDKLATYELDPAAATPF